MTAHKSTLGDVAEFINGAAFKPTDWGTDGSKIIRIQNLTDPTKPYNRTDRQVSERLYVQQGDLLVSWSATLAVFEWQDSEVGVLNQHIFRVLPDEKKVDKRYLRHALELALLDMQQHLHGATMLHVNRGEFLSTTLYLPPLPEQRRIAAILDQADALRVKRREALAQLDSLTQSIFIEMFGDPTANLMRWPTKRLSDLVIKGDSINYGVIQPGDDVDEGIPLVRVGDLIDGRVRHDSLKKITPEIESAYKRSRLHGDEILVSCVGTIGVVVLANESEKGFNIARAVARIRLSPGTSREFVAVQLQTESVQRYFTEELRTVSQPTLNIKQLSETKMIWPPASLQAEFSNRMTALRQLRINAHRASSDLDTLFASLQHRAFRGEL